MEQLHQETSATKVGESAQEESRRDSDVREHKDLAAFSYVWVMAFVVYFTKRHSPFARFHSKQAIVLCFLTSLWLVPVVGHFLTLFVVAGMLYGFINASQGQWTDVPVAGSIARGEFSFQMLRKAFGDLWAYFMKKSARADMHPAETSPVSIGKDQSAGHNVDKSTSPRVP